MSKMMCICGHIIVDQTDYLKYKGEIVPDEVDFQLNDKFVDGVESLVIALQNNEKEEWVKNHFGEGYPMNLDIGNMIDDLHSRYYSEQTKTIYQCESCGRILIQKENAGFTTFLPEEGDWSNILGKKS